MNWPTPPLGSAQPLFLRPPLISRAAFCCSIFFFKKLFSLNIAGKLGLAAVSGGDALRDSHGPPVSKLSEYIKINH